MSAFERAVSFILAQEGGYVNDPSDSGGETNFGISKKSYPTLDIANLKQSDAIQIYRTDFWNICRCDEFPPRIAFALFDTAINMGIKTSIRMLQVAANAEPDGVPGPLTIKACHMNSDAILTRFLAQRAVRYANLIKENEKNGKFLYGWMVRLIKVTRYSLGLSDEIV